MLEHNSPFGNPWQSFWKISKAYYNLSTTFVWNDKTERKFELVGYCPPQRKVVKDSLSENGSDNDIVQEIKARMQTWSGHGRLNTSRAEVSRAERNLNRFPAFN